MRVVKILSSFIAVAIVIVSCNSNKTPQQLIANSWQIKSISGGISDQMPDSVKTMMSKAVMVFGSDGKFHMENGITPFDGAYSLSDDGKKLTLNPTEGGNVETDSIVTLTANQLIVVDTSGTKFECGTK